MSLVNDMLKDLEAGKREPLPDGVSLNRVAQGKGRSALPLLSLFSLVAIIPFTFYIGLNWQASDSSAAPEVGAQAIESTIESSNALSDSSTRDESAGGAKLMYAKANVEPVQAVVQELMLDTQPAVPASAAASPESDSESVRSPAEEKAIAVNAAPNSEKITQLLGAAELALLDDRLTSPLDDNAFTRYQTVLLLEPSHPEAMQGIQRIAERYVDFYAAKVRAGNMQAASLYLDKAQRVVNRYPQLALWLNRRVGAVAEEIALAAEQAPATGPESSPAQSTGDAYLEAPAQANRAGTGQAVRKSHSKGELDKRIAVQAHTLMQQGRHTQAQSLLRTHLQSNPDAQQARKTLFDIYLAADNVAAAQQQLNLLAGLPAHEQAQMKARIKMQESDLAAAVAVMEQAPPAVSDVPSYHSYLAALYHKAARFDAAADLYQQLLSVDGRQATYWLGLAVSLDALNDKPAALRAFRYARMYGKPDASSRAYVEERIQTLSG